MGISWGLTGPQFLAIYGIVFVGVLILAVVVRCWPQPSPPGPVRLTDEELGYLVGGAPRTLLVALGALRRQGVVEAGAQRRLNVATGAVGRSDLQNAVLDAARRGTAGPKLLTDVGVMRAIVRLRTSLAERGLVYTRGRQTLLALVLAVLWATWIVGTVRAVHGWVEGLPTVYLTVMQVVLFIVLCSVGRRIVRQRHRRTDRLVADVRRTRIDPGSDEDADHRFGDRVVLAGIAGVPLALTGAGALMVMDPSLATAVEAHRMNGAGASGGGSYSSTCSVGSSDSGSSSSCGGSSSSCGGGGGGGCGGGCGGGGS